LAILVSSILVMVLFWLVLPQDFQVQESNDYMSFYEPVARRILSGEGYVDGHGNFTARSAPGYPLLLAGVFYLAKVFGLPERSMLAAFISLNVGASAVLLYLTASRIWKGLGGLIASLMWVTYPLNLWIGKQPNSETPFMTFLYASFCLLLSASVNAPTCAIYSLSGLLLGFAMLIRPIAIGLGPLFIGILWLIHRSLPVRYRIQSSLALLVGIMLVVLPWEIQAYARTNRVILLSTAPVESVTWGLAFAESEGIHRPIRFPNDVETLIENIAAKDEEIRTLGDVITLLAAELHDRPLAVIKLYGIKAIRSWYGTSSYRFEGLIGLVQLVYAIPLLLSSLAAWKSGKRARNLVTCIWLIVLYFWGMTTFAGYSIMRYMLPAIGLLFAALPGLLQVDRVSRVLTWGINRVRPAPPERGGGG
jgi:4-amino-4-deoxy-L-arabinose transferase-like glycosyltransferase